MFKSTRLLLTAKFSTPPAEKASCPGASCQIPVPVSPGKMREGKAAEPVLRVTVPARVTVLRKRTEPLTESRSTTWNSAAESPPADMIRISGRRLALILEFPDLLLERLDLLLLGLHARHEQADGVAGVDGL